MNPHVRTGAERVRFALLVGGITAIVAALPFVWVDHLSGSLRDAMSSSGQIFEGRSVAIDPADNVPIIKASSVPYKQAVP